MKTIIYIKILTECNVFVIDGKNNLIKLRITQALRYIGVINYYGDIIIIFFLEFQFIIIFIMNFNHYFNLFIQFIFINFIIFKFIFYFNGLYNNLPLKL